MPEFDAVVPQKLEPGEVDFGVPGAELDFIFDVNKVTPLWFATQQEQLNAGEVLAVANALADVIDSWNLTIGGQPAPPDAKTLARFPISHLLKIMDVIAETPSRAEGEVSSTPSSLSPPAAFTDSTQPPPERSPSPIPDLNGATSTSPAPSASPSPT